MESCSAIRTIAHAFLAATLALGVVIQSWAVTPCAGSTNQARGAPLVSVRVDPESRPAVGKPIVVHWEVQGANESTCKAADFLVLAMPASIRLAGEGFFAVPDGAPAPFGIDAWSTSTRIFVPLQLSQLTTRGAISITPYTAGSLSLHWKVMSVRNGVAADVPGSASETRLVVASASPTLTVSDPVFFSGWPRRVLVSPDGTVRLEDYGDHFRIVDAKSQREMFQGPGARPAFSPTGRFVYFFNASTASGDADATALQVLDRAIGQIIIGRTRGGGVGQDTIVSLRWGLGDAILSLGTAKDAIVETYETLIDRLPFVASLGPNCCNVISEKASVHIDLDNLSLTYSSKDNGFDTAKVESLAFSSDGAMKAMSPKDFSVITQLRKQDDADPNTLHTAPDGRSSYEIQESLGDRLAEYLNAHRVIGRKSGQISLNAAKAWDEGGRKLNASSVNSLQASTQQGRFVRSADQLANRDFEIGQSRAPEQGSLAGDHFAQRLIASGLKLQEPAVMKPHSPPHGGEDVLNAVAANKLAAAVVASMPQAKSFFSDGNRACNPSIDKKEDGNKIAPASIIDMREFKDGDLRVWLIVEGCYTSPSVSDYFARIAVVSSKGASAAPQLIWLNAKPVDQTTVNDAMGLATIPLPAPSIDAELYSQRHLLLSITDRPELLDYDLETGKAEVFRAVARRTGAAQRVYRTEDGRIVRLDRDGSVHIFLPNQQREYLSGRYVDDEFVVFDDVGFYDGTDEGARYVYLNFSGLPEPASLRQFRTSLRKPFIHDVLVKGIEVPNNARPDLQPPPIAVLSLTAGHPGTVSVDVSATSSTGLSAISLFMDGRLIRTIPASGNNMTQHEDISLAGPALWVTAQAVDRMGTESLPVSVAIPARMRAARDKSHVHVIAVGTDIYDDKKNIAQLRGSAADAVAFVSLVARSKLYIDDDLAKPIVNSEHLRENLLQRIDTVARSASQNDTTMVFISGHGISYDGRLFLASRTTIKAAVVRTAIDWNDIASALSRVPGRLIVFLDTCHSGAANAPNEGAATSLLGQGSILILSASKGRETSRETHRRGVFSGAMSRLVDQSFKRVDTNGNGVIELDELYRALKIQVVTETNGKQTPWIARNGLVGPVPIL
ncbi:caspase family protein [Burkholderia ambifaria]|uniref:caspase family protein n=1 Tax=Burkholderia ambifaria TaxID=152480 RepID=UPI001C935276|nr:caspase family protein [Burkholderia ambifaria]MBY4771897.1 caspase family protein [Burkholderia ambifaria]